MNNALKPMDEWEDQALTMVDDRQERYVIVNNIPRVVRMASFVNSHLQIQTWLPIHCR
jgi:hypothetical protein